jgi:hypothetical protein
MSSFKWARAGGEAPSNPFDASPSPSSVRDDTNFPPARAPSPPNPFTAPAPRAPLEAAEFPAAHHRMAAPHVFLEWERERAVLKQQLSALLSERNALREEREAARATRAMEARPAAVIARLARGEQSKSLGQKAELLDEAEASGDTEALCAVVSYCADTLDQGPLFSLLESRPAAIVAYKRLLEASRDVRTHVLLLRHLKRPQEEGMLRVFEAYKQVNAKTRLESLRGALSQLTQAPKDVFPPALVESVSQAVDLLARQLAIDAADAEAQKKGVAIFQAGRPKIVGSPLAFTLHYLHTFHHSLPADKLSSPLNFFKHFQPSQSLYEYVMLKARAKAGDWAAVRAIPKAKGIFSKSLTTHISLRLFFEAVATSGAPRDLQVEFCRLVEPPEDRYGLAVRFHLWDVAVETLCNPLGDQVMLIKLRNGLMNNFGAADTERARLEIERIVSPANPLNIKWKKLVDPDCI